MGIENSKKNNLSYEDLLQQNQALSQQAENLNQQLERTWELYAETSRKLQVYSASIKAAVSSLLNHELFWDSANQHEFLETINTSVSQVSDLVVLLTLGFRAEAGSLEIKRAPQILQEILLVTQARARLKFPELVLQISYPADGKMALVDYEYFMKALMFLFEVIRARVTTEQIIVTASENNAVWFIDLSGFDTLLMNTIEQMHNCKTTPVSTDFLSAENILRLHIACEILHMQEISIEVLERSNQTTTFRMCVPAVANR